jgi:HEAT repeat protein
MMTSFSDFDRGLERTHAVIDVAVAVERRWNAAGKQAAADLLCTELSLEDLLFSLRHEDCAIRTKTLYLIALLSPETAAEVISQVLMTDPSEIVRHEAAYFLGVVGGPMAMATLTVALSSDPSAIVRHEVAEALGEIGGATEAIGLELAQRDIDPLVRETARIAYSMVERRTRRG